MELPVRSAGAVTVDAPMEVTDLDRQLREERELNSPRCPRVESVAKTRGEK